MTSAAASAAGKDGQEAGGLRSRHNLDTQESEASQMSPETRAKLAAAQRGCTPSPETRAKLAAAHKGRTYSPEARARMSAARKGRPGHPCSPETRAKISAALKGRSGP